VPGDLEGRGGTTSSFPYFRAIEERRKSWLDRALSILADVRPGEGGGALLLSVNLLLLLAAYYMLKTVREALILSEGGAEVKAYSSAAQAVLLLLIVPAYGALASRVNRIQLITWVTLFFVSHLAAFYIFGSGGAREGVLFFIWVGIFNVFVIAQFWAFANDLYTEAQGKRLFAIIGVGSSLGAWLGARASSSAVRVFGPYMLMLFAAGLLISTVGISLVIHRRASRTKSPKDASDAGSPLGKEGGFGLVLKERYLLLIALLMVVLNVVNTTGEFLLGKLVVAEAARVAGTGPEALEAQQRFIGAFYGDFFSWVNLIGLGLQMFLVSRIIHFIGVRGALLILPCLAFGSYSLLLVMPVLPVVRFFKVLENGTDYSIQNTARQALFLVTSREAKYKAKAAIDTFFMRAGDVLAAGVVFLGTTLSFSLPAFAFVNVCLTGAWLVVVAGIRREHRKRSAEAARTVPA
jgi:AAA family ATP:ADP antiporter